MKTMKTMKRYSKPTIEIENFVLSSSIANSCDNSWGFEIDTLIDILKSQGWTPAEIQAELDRTYGEGKVCYHTSQGDNVFNS